MHSRPATLLTLALLGLVTVAGAALRLRDVGHSLWLDELHTAWCVANDWGDVAPRARIGNYSPAYPYVVWASTRFGGLNEWALRLPSLLAGMALIPVMGFAAGRLTGSRIAGLTAATIVALDGSFFGWYAQEARPFALVQLLAVVHVWVFFELVSFEQRKAAHYALRALLVGATVALFYLHYTTVLLLCGELAWYALRRPLFRGANAQPVTYATTALLDLALAAVACLPAGAHLAEIFARRANWEEFVFQPTWSEFLALFQNAGWALAVSLAVLSAALALGAALRSRPVADSSTAHRSPASGAALSFCCCLAPLGMAALLTYTGVAHVCHPRYLMASSVALPIAAAWGVALAGRRHAGLAAAMGVLTVCLMQVRIETGPAETGAAVIAEADPTRRLVVQPITVEHFVEDWRGAVEFVRQRDPEGRQAVFLWAGLIEARAMDGDDAERSEEQPALRQYLLFPVTGPYSLGDGRAMIPLVPRDDGWLTPDAAGKVQTAGGGWFIFRSPEAIYPDHPKPVERLARDLGEELATQGVRCRVTQRRSFRGLAVVHLVVEDARRRTMTKDEVRMTKE